MAMEYGVFVLALTGSAGGMAPAWLAWAVALLAVLGVAVLARAYVRERRARNSALDSARMLQGLLDESRMLIGCCRADGTIEFLNRAYAGMLGRTPAECVGANLFSLLPPAVAANVRAAFDAITPEIPVRVDELPLEALGGTRHYRWINQMVSAGGDGTRVFIFFGEDVTAMRRLRQENEYLAAIVRESRDICIARDLDLRILAVNRACLAEMGLPNPESVVGRTLDELFPDERHRTEIAIVNQDDITTQTLPAGTILRRTVPWRDLSGRERYFDSRKFPICDKRGALIGTATIIADITEAHRINTENRCQREELSRQKTYLETIFNSVEFGIFVIDVLDGGDYRYSDVNPAVCRVLKLPREAVIGLTPEELVPHIPPAQAARIRARYDACVRTGEPQGAEEFVEFMSGPRWWWVRVTPIREAGGVVRHLVGCAADVTELRDTREALAETRQRLDLALETANDGIWDYYPESGHAIYSPRWFTILGYAPEQFPMQVDTWSNLLHPDDRERTLQVMNEYNARPVGEYLSEFRMRAADGSWRRILSRGRVVDSHPDGRARRIVGAHTDVTDLRATEEKLHHAQKMEAVGMLAGGIAHDFNNLLGGIMGYADLLTRRLEADSALQHAAIRIGETAEKASVLTSQLLSFSRRNEFRSVRFDIRTPISSATALLQHSIDRRITVRTSLPAEPACLCGDPIQIENAILNLGLNARDAMPDGGEISIRLRRVELDAAWCATVESGMQPGPHIHLCIADTGVGMVPEVRERIFDPFFTTKPVGQGTGLGLSAVYGAVRAHGGVIQVQTAPRKGSEFHLYFPMVDAPADAAEESEAVAPKPAQGGGGTVLLVDDEPVIREVTTRLLEDAGYRVIAASNGAEGAATFAARRAQIDLVVLDVVMPRMSGRECYQAIRAISPEVPVIFSSGFTRDQSVFDLVDNSRTGFIKKPCRERELCAAVEQYLARARQQMA